MDQNFSPIPRHRLSDELPKLCVNQLDDLQRLRELDAAVKQGRVRIIDKLLAEGAPVNRGPLYCKVRTPLYSSVFLGDPEVVKVLLQKGASVNAHYCSDTPLTLAMKCGKFEIVDLLLESKTLDHYSSAERITHFHIACMRNQFDIAKQLLKSKQDVNAAVDIDSDYWPGFTALHFAVQFQCVKTVEFLLKNGSDFTLADARQFTPLHLAHMIRHEEIIDMILEAHKEVFSNPADSKGLSHFHIACTRNKPDMVEHFESLGVKIDDPLSEKSFYWKRKTAIDLAIQYECVDVVKLLLHKGALLRSHSEDRFDFIKNAHCTGNMEIVDLVTVNERLGATFKITEKGEIEMTRHPLTLIPSILDSPNVLDSCSLLNLAIKKGNQNAAKTLLDAGVDFTVQDIQGQSALHLAFERDMGELVNLMLEYYENFTQNPIRKDGLSHLHIACAKNHVKTIEHLLEHGANANDRINSDASFWGGFTSLHFAAGFGNVEATEVLLRHGSNYSITDSSGISAFDLVLLSEANNEGYEEGSSFGVMKTILEFHYQHRDPSFSDRGMSLLHLACVDQHHFGSTVAEMVELLAAYPDDVNKAIHHLNTGWDGHTPLFFALPRQRHEHATMLMKAGADILKQASNGDTPMHLIWGFLSSEFGLDLQNNRFFESNHIGSSGYSIFHRAAEQSDIGLIKYFLEHGVDPNCPSIEAGTGCLSNAPLHVLTLDDLYDSIDAVELLLDHGADPNVREYRNNTPLHFMIRNRHPEIIDILVSHGADIDARNALCETPFISFCNNLCITNDDMNDMIESFLDNGADINLVDVRDLTPLALVCAKYEAGSTVFENFPIVIDTLLKHIMKLEILGYFVSEKNKGIDHDLRRRRNTDFRDGTADDRKFQAQCVTEVELLKRTRTDSYSTLYDILFKHPNQLAVLSQNVSFLQIVNSDNFHEKFPIYGFMLKSQLTQGVIRWPLLTESRVALNRLLAISLPLACTEGILHYLSNQDLKNVIMSIEKK